MGLNFAEGNYPHELRIDRTDANNGYLGMLLRIGTDAIPVDARLRIGRSYRDSITIDRTLSFDANGVVLKDLPEYGVHAGEKLDIVGMIQKLTTEEGLGTPTSVDQLIKEAKEPQLAS
jgi:hypothetical protein